MHGNLIRVKAELDSLDLVRRFIAAHAGAAGLPQSGAGDLLLAVDEAVSNIVMHGTRQTEVDIEVSVIAEPDGLTVTIRDNAAPFDPTAAIDPHLDSSPLDRDKPGGFGLHLLPRLVDRMVYRVTSDGRNELALMKKRP